MNFSQMSKRKFSYYVDYRDYTQGNQKNVFKCSNNSFYRVFKLCNYV